MTAPGHNLLFLALTFSILMSSSYALGRIHQWHKHGHERDEEYRRGYDRASLAILSLMNQHGPAAARQRAGIMPVAGGSPPRLRGRHARDRVRT